MTLEEELDQYAKEIGVPYMTITHLIGSHRRLREQSLATNEVRRKELEKEREKAYEWAKNQALKYDWFSRERILDMTIAELVEEFGEEGPN